MVASPEHLNSMVQYCLGFAEQMLSNAGAFYPFGAVLNAQGIVESFGAYDGDEHSSSQDIYLLLVNGMRARSNDGDIIGAAIAVDVNVPTQFESPHPDGVRVTLEADGYSRYLYFPYEPAKKGLFKKVGPKFAEPFAVETNPEIFVQ